MSSPYVYAPDPNSHYSNNYHHTPYYYHTPRAHTPFLPPSPRSMPGSPHHTTALPPVTPNSPHHIPFPTSGYDPDVNYGPWDIRERRPSWHSPRSAELLHPNYPPFQGPYGRRHSFGNASYQPPPQPQFSPWSASSYTPFSPQLVINPWINAAAPRQDFFFDLAPAAFTPLRLFGPGQSGFLSAEEMQEPATHPPLTRLRIICDVIPNWPIDLEFRQQNTTPYSPYSPNQFAYQQQQAPPPPISLADVLIAVHQAMHRRITHDDWAKLNRHDSRAVTKAYMKRCGMSEYEKSQGVKRVDFLLGRTRMVGLVRDTADASESLEVMRLILADR